MSLVGSRHHHLFVTEYRDTAFYIRQDRGLWVSFVLRRERINSTSLAGPHRQHRYRERRVIIMRSSEMRSVNTVVCLPWFFNYSLWVFAHQRRTGLS